MPVTVASAVARAGVMMILVRRLRICMRGSRVLVGEA